MLDTYQELEQKRGGIKMNHKEIVKKVKKEMGQVIRNEIVRRKMTNNAAARLSGGSGTNVSKFVKDQEGMSIDAIIMFLDGMGLTLAIEDKVMNWDSRLKILPRKLFTGARIEARVYIKENGLDARVDLFETPEAVLQFVPTPCDVYEIYPLELLRNKFEVVDHPFGTLYSYNDNISPDYIESRTGHR